MREEGILARVDRYFCGQFTGEAANLLPGGVFDCAPAQRRARRGASQGRGEDKYLVSRSRLLFREAAHLGFQAPDAWHVRVRDVNNSHYASVSHKDKHRPK